jgi:hypothetical protein
MMRSAAGLSESVFLVLASPLAPFRLARADSILARKSKTYLSKLGYT